ncbi:MAG: PHP domain-containing protein [Lachnospiraceae bacterium]|nr:PHP domain-containing protein [Lachnospiraceae bacterium]
MRPIDLHAHTICSDGSLTPTELVNLGIQKGLAALAITDHDSVAGIEEAMQAANGKDIEIIPGVELSTEYEGQDIHIVGLYINYREASFVNHLQKFIESRDLRNEKMCKRLQEEGIDITYDALLSMYPGCVITRSHYAGYLYEKGYIKSRVEAFERYIGDHAKCYVPREKITPAEGVSLILNAGGIPVLAHPILYHMSDNRLDTLVKTLKESGLVGIEAVYSTYKPADERDIKRLAIKYDLALSGGSDFHGDAKPGLELGTGYGHLFVPEDFLPVLKEKRNA